MRFTTCSSGNKIFATSQRAQTPLPGAADLPVLGQLVHLHLQTLNLVSKVLLEEPVGLHGRVAFSLRLFASAFESWEGGGGVV